MAFPLEHAFSKVQTDRVATQLHFLDTHDRAISVNMHKTPRLGAGFSISIQDHKEDVYGLEARADCLGCSAHST